MIGDCGDIEVDLGLLVELVLTSIIVALAVVKEPRELTSTETFAVKPRPLLWVCEAPAWPREYLTGNT
jgi:hypothetical protein